jgi:hypothetical protein
MTEYIEVSLEDYNNKTKLIKEQRVEIEDLKKRIAGLEKELRQIYNI